MSVKKYNTNNEIIEHLLFGQELDKNELFFFTVSEKSRTNDSESFLKTTKWQLKAVAIQHS